MHDSAAATFLFTDIEGSSRLWEHEPARMRVALARHDAILRSAVERNGGTVVKMTGEGVHAVFRDPADAVRAALDLQQALARPESADDLYLPVRCGLHLGVEERRDNDYFGPSVNGAARIMSAAHRGQVLMSHAVVEHARDRLDADVTLVDPGVVNLRDLAKPEHVYQLAHPRLRREFPALRALASTPNNLPQQLTSFVGREAELAKIEALLASTRLLTLPGPAGREVAGDNGRGHRTLPAPREHPAIRARKARRVGRGRRDARVPPRARPGARGPSAAGARRRAASLLAHRARLADLGAKSRRPTVYTVRDFVDAGGLVSYGPSLVAQYRRAASFADKILKGAKPAELPVEQPTTFELVINVKTAKTLGLTMPPNVLLRADRVIE